MASINDKIKIEWKTLAKELQEFPGRVSKNVVRRAIYAGAVVVRDNARSRVAVDTGALKASVVAQAGSSKNKNQLVASIGIRKKLYQKGKRKGKYARRYAHLVEFGTAHSAAQPFMRPALDSNSEKILQVVAAKLREGIDVETAKNARKKK